MFINGIEEESYDKRKNNGAKRISKYLVRRRWLYKGSK